MSIGSTKQALEVALLGITPVISTAYENFDFTPVTGVAWQRLSFNPSTPDNAVLGDGYFRENGLWYIDLNYPTGNGSAAALARAELIRTTFKRGTSFSSGGVTVTIPTTPEIDQGMSIGGFWVVRVIISWYAQVFSA